MLNDYINKDGDFSNRESGNLNDKFKDIDVNNNDNNNKNINLNDDNNKIYNYKDLFKKFNKNK